MFNYNGNKTDKTVASAPTPFAPIDDVSPEWAAADAAVESPFAPIPIAEPSYGSSTVVDSSSSVNVLHSDVHVSGILRFRDELLVDGTVDGEITSDGTLTVGENATITAQDGKAVAIRTKNAIIRGKVYGNVVVTGRVELATGSELVGDVIAARLAVQDGAVFIGRSEVGVASKDANISASSTVLKASAKTDKGASAGNMPDLLS